MAPSGSIELLLVEDNPDDVELTLHTFEDFKFTNRIHVARDGAEALDFIFCRGRYASRNIEDRPGSSCWTSSCRRWTGSKSCAS